MGQATKAVKKAAVVTQSVGNTTVTVDPNLLTSAQVKAISALTTVSAIIRYLDSEGMKRGPISKAIGKRYQHVRNVLLQPLKQKA